MKTVLAVAVGLFVCGLSSLAIAADGPTGTWKWEFKRGDQTREVTLKLKLEGDKLTGSMPGRNNTETAIENGSFKDGVVSFSVTREFNGNKRTTKYSGKLDGDTIKGETESPGRDGGDAVKRPWEAKRAAE